MLPLLKNNTFPILAILVIFSLQSGRQSITIQPKSIGISLEDAEQDYYEILGITETATPLEIKTTYRSLIGKWHPDKNPDNREEAESMSKKINKAHEILSDPDVRAAYDTAREGLKEEEKKEAEREKEYRKRRRTQLILMHLRAAIIGAALGIAGFKLGGFLERITRR